MQTDIAAAVARALNVTLADNTAGRRAPTTASAHEHFLQGQFFYNRRGPDDLERALHYFQEAVTADSQYARAWAALAGAYGAQLGERETAPSDTLVRRAEAVQRTLTLDPNLAEAHVRAAQYYWDIDDRSAAAAHHRRAMQLEPGNAQALGLSAAVAAWNGRLDEAVEAQRRAALLDPLSALQRGTLGYMLFVSERYEEAEKEFRVQMELEPDLPLHDYPSLAVIRILQRRFDDALPIVQPWPQGEDRDQALALIHHRLGDEGQAAAALEQLTARPEFSAAVRASEVYAFRGEFDEAFRWLQTSNDRLREDPWNSPQGRWVLFRRLSPFLRPLYADPRWQSVVLACDERRGQCLGSDPQARVAQSKKQAAAN